VTVLAFELPNVGLAKERAHCDFSRDGFDLTVHDVPPAPGAPGAAAPGARPTSYRLRVLNLEKDIDPARSSFKVKKSSVEIKLKKTGQWDHWMELTSKKSREAKKAEAERLDGKADPSASINDMMRQMYEDGDEATRKVIGEAMLKSREEQARGGGGAGGLAGDFGGGGGGKRKPKKGGLGSNLGGPSFGGGLDDEDDDFGLGSGGGGGGGGGEFDDL